MEARKESTIIELKLYGYFNIMHSVVLESVKHHKLQLTEVDVINFVEFLLRNGFAFDDWNDLNEHEIEFFRELKLSYELMTHN